MDANTSSQTTQQSERMDFCSITSEGKNRILIQESLHVLPKAHMQCEGCVNKPKCSSNIWHCRGFKYCDLMWFNHDKPQKLLLKEEVAVLPILTENNSQVYRRKDFNLNKISKNCWHQSKLLLVAAKMRVLCRYCANLAMPRCLHRTKHDALYSPCAVSCTFMHPAWPGVQALQKHEQMRWRGPAIISHSIFSTKHPNGLHKQVSYLPTTKLPTKVMQKLASLWLLGVT